MSHLAVKLITIYQRTFFLAVVPLLKLIFPVECRFFPTCSEYARESFGRWGFKRGLVLSSQRLAKCHPWQAGGVDLVPLPKFKI